MDCLQLLEQDHEEVKQMFKKLEKAEGAQASRLFEQLRSMLTLHEELEETLFYPELKKEKAATEIVLESYQEHHVIDVLIGEISQFKPSDEQWSPKITVLMENTEHHIKDEEGELFPKVRKIWDAEKRRDVGRQMQQMKEERQRHPTAAR